MAPYVILALAAGVGGYLFCERKPSRKRELLFLAVMTAAMVIMALIRNTTVGLDYEWVYKNYFLTVCEKDFSWLFTRENLYWKEPVYGLLNYAVSLFTRNPVILAGVVSALIILLRMAFVARYSSSVWLSVFIYASCGFFGYSMCTLRQELGISVAMFAIPFLQRKNPLPYFALILLAGICHNSLLVFLPVYFVANWPMNKITLPLYAGGTLFLLLFSEPIIGWFTDHVERFAMYKPGTYFMQGRSFNTIFVPLIFFILAFLMRGKLLERKPENIVLLNLYTYAAALFVLAAKNFVFQRLALMFLPVLLLLLPEIFQSMKPTAQQLEILGRLSESDKPQERQRAAALRKRYQEDAGLYNAALGLVMGGCMLYLAFLLSANTLGLVPYVTLWSAGA